MSPQNPNPPQQGQDQPTLKLTATEDYRDGYANSVQVRMSVWDFFLVFGTMSQQSADELFPARQALRQVRVVFDEFLREVAVRSLRLALVDQGLEGVAIQPLVGFHIGRRGRRCGGNEHERGEKQGAHGELR